MKPKRLTKKWDRDSCRRMRNQHWLFMEQIRDAGGLMWFCPWDKYRKHGADGVMVDGLIGWGLLNWMCSHKDWFKRGGWSEKRCARPVRLTEAGLAALENWWQYDMEPVEGGLVEPGWICTPTPLIRKASIGN